MCFRKPVMTLKFGETSVELWVRERAMPARADSIIAPVGTNLKMGVGIAKWVRDEGSGKAQSEALKAAPLAPGESFVGTGGRYRFESVILAVVMDDQKRFTGEWITTAVAESIREAGKSGAESVLLPDMTDDLLRQPVWISQRQRNETCEPIARAMLEGVRMAQGSVRTVKLWVWRKDLLDVWNSAFKANPAKQEANV